MKRTPFGFQAGAADVSLILVHKTGAVTIGVDTPKGGVQVYVTRTGKIRVWFGREELKPTNFIEHRQKRRIKP